MMLSQRQIFLNHVAQTSPSPMGLEIVRAEGYYLFDADGKRYTDLISGISVSNIGHCHPKVIEAVNDQMKRYAHLMVYGEFVQYPQTKLAEKITSLLPKKLNSVYFTNSGAEATEGAMKLAKRATGRNEIISFRNSYHGSTQGALSIMGSEEFKTAFRPLLPGNRVLNFNSLEDLNKITNNTAAVFAEVIQAESGIIPADEDWLFQLRKRCDETGAILVFDEIQTGFGRTGKMFAFEHYNVYPDILLLGKSLGGGLPLGAFISNWELMNELTLNPVLGHITTFGGNPVCCAAALASIEVIESEGCIENAIQCEKIFQNFTSNKIKRLSYKGLFGAIEFNDQQTNFKVIERCLKEGLVTDWFLFNSSAMRIAPPLTISIKSLTDSFNLIKEIILMD